MAGIVFRPGDLSLTPAGSIKVVFDVNFLGSGADTNSQNLLVNMLVSGQYFPVPVTQ